MPRDHIDTANTVRARKLFGPRIEIRTVEEAVAIPTWFGRRAALAAPSDRAVRFLALHIATTTRRARSGTAGSQ